MDYSIPEDYQIMSALPEELADLFVNMNLPAYRAAQLFQWIHKKNIVDLKAMSNLPDSLKAKLAAVSDICPVKAGKVLTSKDGTRKIEVVLKDGNSVETVLIPEEGKLTQCISSQVGCAVGCTFCRSGKSGLQRNLTAAEITGQIFVAKKEYFKDERLRNVVLMGVGEPLHNMSNVLRALELLSHPDGIGLSSRRVTLSTVGIINGIDRLAKATGGKTALAVSLHAADNQVRAALVPGVSSKVEEIVNALKRYPLAPRRRFTIEYVLVKGVNDSNHDAEKLVKLLSHLKVKVNLLPLNPHDLTNLEPPDENRVLAFQNILLSKGVSAFVRKKRGDDINAACGQLLSINKKQQNNDH